MKNVHENCACGVPSIDISQKDAVKKRTGCIEINDFYSADTFECLKCPNDLLTQEFYTSVGVAFHNCCELIANFIEDKFGEIYDIKLGELTYAFIVCKEGSLRGACGYESFNDDGNYRFKLYINPLIADIKNTNLHNFTMILNIAIHEMTHTYLHMLCPEMYHVKLNHHCPEFFEILTIIDEFFYDRVSLMNEVWDYALKN